MNNKHYNDKDTGRDKDKKLTPLEKLENTTSDEEFQREFDKILKENRKATDEWFRLAYEAAKEEWLRTKEEEE